VFKFDYVPDISLGNRVCTEQGEGFLLWYVIKTLIWVPCVECFFNTIFSGSGNAVPNAMFQSTNERCLSGHVMYTETNVIEASACVGYCLNAGEKCKSINYIDQDNGTCQLNNSTMTDYPLHVTVDKSCTYYQPVNVVSY
jgi:hypothetical protein